jgi:hypothetical protein
VNSFRLVAIPDTAALPAGISDLLMSDVQSLEPPGWADSLSVFDSDESAPDGLLLIFGGPPPPELRASFFDAFQRNTPIASLCYGKLPEGDTIIGELSGLDRCWSFSSDWEIS